MALFQVVATIHTTFIVDAVSDPEHMSDFMSHYLACSVQHQVLGLFLRADSIPVEFWRIPIKTEDTRLGHHVGEPEDKAKTAFLRVNISCGDAQDTYRFWVGGLKDSEKPAQDLACVVLDDFCLLIRVWKSSKI